MEQNELYYEVGDGYRMISTIMNVELISHVPTIIDSFAMEYKGNLSSFYTRLLQEISNSKKYRSYIIRGDKNTPIACGSSGKLLYKNQNASEWEVLFIIGKNEERVPFILQNLKDNFEGQNNAQRRIYFENFEQTLTKEKIEVVLRRPFSNFSKYSGLDFKFEVGDMVKKNSVIAELVHYKFSEEAQKWSARYFIALEHCTIKLNELKNSQPQEGTLKEKLINFWDEKKLEHYYKIILALEAKNNQTEFPFITQKERQLFWVNKPSNGWQVYLAAFIYACQHRGYIDLTELSNNAIKNIVKKTFNITSFLDKVNYSGFHTDKLLKKKIRGSNSITYIQPFLKIMDSVK